MAIKEQKKRFEAQCPLILRCHRLMEAFAKSNDEHDFYLDRTEGFIICVDLDKSSEELAALEIEVQQRKEQYCMIPKFTFYETKKIMEGFIHEKVYDIDIKEKLLDIIQSKEARENFLEFIYDHLSELEKWQQYYQERSRIRIIEWLRSHHFNFVFEEDLELPSSTVDKLKQSFFQKQVDKEVEAARKALIAKAKMYYSNEALNPRPKRGRPPKQIQKIEVEYQTTTDVYLNVSPEVRPFLFIPDIGSAFEVTFSSRFESGQELLANKRQPLLAIDFEKGADDISQKMAALKQLSNRWVEDSPEKEESVSAKNNTRPKKQEVPAKASKAEKVKLNKNGVKRIMPTGKNSTKVKLKKSLKNGS